MKRIITNSISILFSLLIGINGYSQSVEDIIAKHIKAHGGEKNWNKVQSIQISGDYTSFSTLGKIKTVKLKTGEYYSEFDLGQHYVYEANNGKLSWTIDPWQDITFPRRVNKAEQNVFDQKAELCTPFLNYKEKGFKVELKGREDLDGTEVYVITLTRKNGLSETWYLDANTYLEVKCNSQWIDFAYPSQADSFFDDFRKVDGIIIPFYIEREFRQRNRVIEIKDVKINKEVDKDIFKMPVIKEFDKLSFMKGKWWVAAESMTRRGTWYKTDSVKAKFKYEDRNMLKTTLDYETFYFPMKAVFNLTYNSAKKKYMLSIYNDFYSTMAFYEGNWENNKLIVDDSLTRSCNPDSGDPYYFRFEIEKTDEDHFIIERKLSQDKGKTWFPNQRFRFIRRD